jgi:hypothetical protein
VKDCKISVVKAESSRCGIWRYLVIVPQAIRSPGVAGRVALQIVRLSVDHQSRATTGKHGIRAVAQRYLPYWSR